jgi:D-alanine-D-alanine ligase
MSKVMALNITLMLGGPSAEREISLRSGAAVARALRSLGHTVTELDPQEDAWSLPPDTDLVFLALHGTYGEDGTVQGRLDSLGVPYTGCGTDASRLAFDKLLTKQRCIAAGLSTPRFTLVKSPSTGWPLGWKPPVVLKPLRQGSSVGLQLVDDVGRWRDALAEAFKHDSELLVEENVLGREVTVGILAGEPLPIVEIRPKEGAYTYLNKYTVGATDYLCPAPMDPTATRRIQITAVSAYRAIGGRDYARVDLIVRPDGEPVVLEINTLPGMTETSLFPKAAAALGIDFPGLCQRMVEQVLRRTPAPSR